MKQFEIAPMILVLVSAVSLVLMTVYFEDSIAQDNLLPHIISSTGINASSTGINASSTGINASSTGINASSTGINASSTGINASSTGINASSTGINASSTGINASSTGINASSTGINASSTGINASSTGINASSTGINASSTGINASSTGINASSINFSPLFSFNVDLKGSSRQIANPILFNNTSKVIFSIGLSDNQTYFKYNINSNTNWSAWIPIGGQSKQIQAVKISDNNIILFSIGINNLTYYKIISLPRGENTNWISLGGQSKQIQAVRNTDNSIGLLSIGIDNKLYYKEKLANAKIWGMWESLGGASKEINQLIDNNGSLVVFSIGPDNSVYYKVRRSPGVWQEDWTSLGGSSKQIAVTSNSDGTMMVFSIGFNDGHVYYRKQLSREGNWTDSWIDLGIQSKQIQISKSHGTPILISVSNSGDVYYKHIVNAPTQWQLLLGIAKANEIVTGDYYTENPSLFMISLGYNQVFYSELLQQPEPILKDTNLHASVVTKGLLFPTSMSFVDANSILVLEKNEGTVRLIRNGSVQMEPVLRVPVNSIGERGLLGILVYDEQRGNELIENNSSTKKVYLYYTESKTAGGKPLGNRLYQYTWNGARLVNPVLIMTLPAEFVDHNGGKIVTGLDGNIYTVIGDQNRNSTLQNIKSGEYKPDAGVIFRIKPDGSAPQDNPFFKFTNKTSMEKYLGYGIRNSFGMAVDPITGNIWDTENGDTGYDEINLVIPGYNGGWKKVMGPIDRSNITKKDLAILPGSKYQDPKFSWYKQIGITDLEFFNSQKLGPAYKDELFVGDFHNGNLYLFNLNKVRTGFKFSQNDGLRDHVVDSQEEIQSIIWGSRFGGVTDIETGPDGYLYVLTFTGDLYKIVPSSSGSRN